jgi:hypothetical protein
MNKKPVRKMRLSRETLHALADQELGGIVGGVTAPNCTDTCPANCPSKISCKWTCVNGSCTC